MSTIRTRYESGQIRTTHLGTSFSNCSSYRYSHTLSLAHRCDHSMESRTTLVEQQTAPAPHRNFESLTPQRSHSAAQTSLCSTDGNAIKRSTSDGSYVQADTSTPLDRYSTTMRRGPGCETHRTPSINILITMVKANPTHQIVRLHTS
jgi:hypothetical protein